MLNKKVLAVYSVLLCMAGAAYAGKYDDTTFNAGIELSIINETSYNNSFSGADYYKASSGDSKLAIEKNEPGVNVFVGARFTENWGGQAGFSFIQTAKANVQNGQSASNKINNLFIDILGFLNVAQQVDLMAVLGYGMLKSNPSVTGNPSYDQEALTKRKLGYRLGGGVQYYFTDSWASRATLIYQKGNPVFLKSLISFSVGLLYSFS